MIAAWMLVALVLGALVAAAAWCAAGLAATRRWPVRWAWAAGLATLVALVALAPWRTMAVAPATVPVPTARVAVVTTVTDDTPRSPVTALVAAVGALRRDAFTTVDRAAALPVPVQRVLGAAWLLASLVVTATLALAWRRVTRATRALPVTQVDGTTVRVARDGSPSVIGVRAPAIVLPAWALALPAGSRAMVVAHERAHRDAHDPALLVFGAVVVALLPWHPAAWWMAARLATAIETDCDARVLAAGVPVRDYGALLLDVAAARRVPSLLAPWPALGGRRSTLETRIRAMTSARPRFPLLRSGLLATAAGALVVVACDSSRLPTSADIERMDAATAAARIEYEIATPREGVPTRYTVNDSAVSATVANAIPAERIASINVIRSSRAGDSSVIAIVTKDAAAARAPITAITSNRTGDTLLIVRDSIAIRRMDTTTMRVMLRADGTAGPTQPALARAPLTVGATAASPIYLIDGVRADARAMQALDPDRIASVEVLKGIAATAAYGADGANGVIRITTKPR